MSDPGVRAVVFDIDQTLWDFARSRRRALTACLELIDRRASSDVSHWDADHLQARYDRLEADATGEQLSHTRRRSLAEAAREAAPGDPRLGDELHDLYFSIRHAPADPYLDVDAALAGLRDRGLRLAAVSNGNTDMERIGLAHHFDPDVVVLGPRLGMAKPEARIYREVERRLGFGPDALVCVGDDPVKDVSAPQQMGWRGVWNNRDGQRLPHGVLPDAIVESLDQLVVVIDGWLAG